MAGSCLLHEIPWEIHAGSRQQQLTALSTLREAKPNAQAIAQGKSQGKGRASSARTFLVDTDLDS